MPVDPKIIYLEADEEVTSIIDKLRKTEFKDVVLVVPKQAGLTQSVVNLKLVKKQAENLGKTVSIVTQDKSGRTLAEKIGIPTSTKVGGKFEIREYDEDIEARKPKANAESDGEIRGPLEETEEVLVENGELMGDDEIIFRESEDLEQSREKEDLEEEYEDDHILPKFPYLKVFAGFFVFLVLLAVAGFVYLPRAKATIYMNTEKKQVTIEFTGKKDVALDTERAIIPTKIIEVTKESSKTFPATGKKDVGTKATGVIIISSKTVAQDLLAGTKFNPDGNSAIVFKSDAYVSVPKYPASIEIKVTAENVGDQYNGFKDDSFIVTKLGSNSDSQFVVLSSTNGMAGGESHEITYVSEGDINAAKESVTNDAYDEATTEFNKQTENLKVLEDSKKKEVISFAANPVVNTEATEFSMTVKVSIKAIAFNVEDVSTLVAADVERQLGFAKQVIDSGSDGATVTVSASDLGTGDISATVKSEALVSEKIDQNKVKAELTGLTAEKAQNYIKGLAGVNDVKFEFWPSFIKIFPRLSNHIFLSVETAQGSGGE